MIPTSKIFYTITYTELEKKMSANFFVKTLPNIVLSTIRILHGLTSITAVDICYNA